MESGTREWSDLSVDEKSEFARLYYIVGVPDVVGASTKVKELLPRFGLSADLSSDIPRLLPTAPSEVMCERCGAALRLKALARSGVAKTAEPVLFEPAGWSVELPYRRGRFAQCTTCGHQQGSQSCYCPPCRKEHEAEYEARHEERLRRYEEQEREKQEAEAARHQAEAEFVEETRAQARSTVLSVSQFPERLLPSVRRMFDRYGQRLASGVWLRIPCYGKHGTPDLLEGCPEDVFFVLAHLQVCGWVRVVSVEVSLCQVMSTIEALVLLKPEEFTRFRLPWASLSQRSD